MVHEFYRLVLTLFWLGNVALAQDVFEQNTHWNTDLSKNIFPPGAFAEETDEEPNRWRRLWTLRSKQVEFTDSRVLQLLASQDGQEVSVSMTMALPPDVDYLTFMVRMSASQLTRGSGPNAGGGVVLSFIDHQGNQRELPRIDPNYSGYRRMNEYIKTARAKPGERKLRVQIEVVDATGSLEIEKIHVTRSELEYVLSADDRKVFEDALAGDDAAAIRKLLEKEPRILELRTGEKDNCTPLGRAAWVGSARVAEELIRAGADLEAVDSNWGNTPLQWACWFGRLEAVKVLVENGAKPTNGVTMAQIGKQNLAARKRGPAFDAIIEFLQSLEQRNQIRPLR